DSLTIPIRLLGSAAPGDIVASGGIARQVEAWVRLQPIERSGHPGGAFRVSGLSSARERARGQPGPRLSPFLGREREIETLLDLQAVSARGAGQVVGIVGGPGSGKARRLSALRRRLEGGGVRYDEGRCLALGRLTPYHPLIGMLRAYFEIDDATGAEAIDATVRSGLAALGMDPEAQGPPILRLLGASRARGPLDGDAEGAKARTFEAVCRMAVALAQRQAYALALENAHWIDPTTEEGFARRAEQTRGMPLLLITTYREGYRPPWLGKSYSTQIALRPLRPSESRQLVRAVMAGAELTPHLEEQVLAKAEGNPFFLEELARAMREHQGAGALLIPDSVHAVADVRIDALAAPDKRLLQLA